MSTQEDLLAISAWLEGDKDAGATCARRAVDNHSLVDEARIQRRLHLLLRARYAGPDATIVARRAMDLGSGERSQRQRVQRIVRRIRRPHFSWYWSWSLAAGLLVLLLGGLLTWPQMHNVGRVGTGCVVQRGGERLAITDGLMVRAGDHIEVTIGSELRFHDGTLLALEPGTRLEVSDAQHHLGGGAKRLRLVEGACRAEVAHQPTGAPLGIITSEAEITVLGTVFDLTATEGITHLAVMAGRVRMMAGGTSREVGAGEQARCNRQGFLAEAPPPMVASVPATASNTGADSVANPASPGPAGDAVRLLPVRGDVAPAANPEVVADVGIFRLFTQGPGIPVRTSTDLMEWHAAGRVFTRDPAWFAREMPGYAIWSPAVHAWQGRIHLYYILSNAGGTVLGLATNTTLDEHAPTFRWMDEGLVLRSPANGDHVLDPHVAFDEGGQPWLLLGSNRSGITMRRLDAATGRIAAESQIITLVNGRFSTAPYVERRDGWVWLFFASGNYTTDFTERVGRARTLAGPYLDRQGRDLAQGGGTIVCQGTWDMVAPANACIVSAGGRDHLVTNCFRPQPAGSGRGPRHLLISTLHWDADGWPVTALTPGRSAAVGR